MKKLQDLMAGLPYRLIGPQDADIRDVVFDSRAVQTGTLFVALPGAHVDGATFIKQAVSSGASAIVTQSASLEPSDIPVVIVDNAVQALSHIAPRFWDYPSKKLRMVGITGTNGKTTTSYLIEAILKAAGCHPGALGTISYRFDGKETPAPNTTPFASELQRFLKRVVSGGGTACVMEVSSHALALDRVQGVYFDVAVFTNLTQDHLDFHKTMDAYGAAKMELFKKLPEPSGKNFPKAAVLNADDPFSAKIAAIASVPVITYGVRESADLMPRNLHCDASGSKFDIVWANRSWPVKLKLLGEYNVSNALAAIGVGLSQGFDPALVMKALEDAPGVPGRLERVDAGQAFTVVVDYAHTEDALRRVLGALRDLKPKRIITVFGCGGDRDRTKRPLMGEASAQLSEEVIVTSDNPRSEEPVRITLDIEIGLRKVRQDHYSIVVDRKEAIRQAVHMAQPGDIVLLAGKGHETYQILKDQTIPFDDRQVARDILTART